MRAKCTNIINIHYDNLRFDQQYADFITVTSFVKHNKHIIAIISSKGNMTGIEDKDDCIKIYLHYLMIMNEHLYHN